MLIFFDIDGTLISAGGRPIPDSAAWAIMHARQNGHICMINTGRTQALVGRDVTGDVVFDGFLYGCGTMATFRGETLLHKSFSVNEGARIIEGLRKHKIDAVLEGEHNNFKECNDTYRYELFRNYMQRPDFAHYGTFDEALGNFDKLYCYVEDTTKMHAFWEEFREDLDFVDRAHGFYEIMPKGYSKATAMQFIAAHLGISMADTAAIGDSSNDIPMFACAGTSIAMGNGTEEVKRIADFVTTAVEADGIKNALAHLGVL